VAKSKTSIIREAGAIVLLMVRGLIGFLMVVFMRVSGEITRRMVVEHTTIAMETPIEASFVMGLNMVRELITSQVEMFIREITYLI